MKLTPEAVKKLAPDSKAVTAARSVANPKHWTELGVDGDQYWGRCQGSDLYSVYCNIKSNQLDCSCPSRKRPCKHSLGLLMLAAGGHPIPQAPVPAGLISEAESSYYESNWE